MTVKELMEKRAKAWDTARDFLDTKRNASGLLSEEDAKTYDKLEEEVVALGKEIERLERQEKIDAQLKKPTADAIVGKPHADNPDTGKGTASAAYNKAFWANIRNRGYMDVHNDLRVGEDSEGGYLVPDEFERKLIEALEDENIFRPLATKIKTSFGDRKIPLVTQKGEAYWMEEEEEYRLSDDTFGQLSLSAYKCGTAIRISEELLNDSVFDLNAYITREFARRVGAKEEEAFLVGDGAGKPTGIFAPADSGGASDGGTASGSTSSPITFDDMIELFYSLRAPYRNRATWIMNEQTVKLLRKIKDSNGNYIWQPSVSVGIPDTILNRPYITSVYAPAPESGNRIIAFGDYSYYWIADRQGRSLRRLNELFAMTGQVGYLASERVDGKLILPEAVKAMELA